MSNSQQLAAILRDTLKRVELSADVSPDDSALAELKRIILLKLASLESGADQEPSSRVAPAAPDSPSLSPVSAVRSEPVQPQPPRHASAHFSGSTVHA